MNRIWGIKSLRHFNSSTCYNIYLSRDDILQCITKSWADQHTTYTEAIRIVRSLIKSRAGKKNLVFSLVLQWKTSLTGEKIRRLKNQIPRECQSGGHFPQQLQCEDIPWCSTENQTTIFNLRIMDCNKSNPELNDQYLDILDSIKCLHLVWE